MNQETLWTVFLETGDPGAYLLYAQCPEEEPCPPPPAS